MGSRAKVSILCVNRLLRESIARILTKRTDFEIVIAQMDNSTLCEQTLDSGADVLVLDSLDVLLGNFDLSSSAGADNLPVKTVLIAMTDGPGRGFLTEYFACGGGGVCSA